MSQWTPTLSLKESDAILCTPGNIHEVETALIEGRLYRVYKNLWPSLQDFWLAAVNRYSDKTYIVFDDQRLTYGQVHQRALRVAAFFHDVHGVRNGDRIGICSRNCPEYLITFWACHLLGAVSVLANAWLPLEPLHHCFIHTNCKLILLDAERAVRLERSVAHISQDAGTKHFFVFDNDIQKSWKGIDIFNTAVDNFTAQGPVEISRISRPILPEDNATIIFTSGTTGLPKGVLSTQRQFLTNVLNVLVGGYRAALRSGAALPSPFPEAQAEQKAALVAVPLFHVTGLTTYSMLSTLTGMRIILMRKWVLEEAARLIKREKISVAGGVPAMVADLIDSSLVGYPLEGLLFGGSPAPDALIPRARKAFPTAVMTQGYGLTETNSIAVSISGDDYIARPTSTGIPSPVNEMLIIRDGKVAPPGGVGEVWLRGPNVMKEYWSDPEATARVITEDGWLRSGDLGFLDEEGFLYVKDRLKDIIIRGGENVDSVSVENVFYADPRISEAAAVGIPDERLGELVAAVVSVKPAFQGLVTEAMLMDLAHKSLPRFAVPVMIVILDVPFKLTPSGKIIKGELRKIVQQEWDTRRKTGREPSLVHL